MGFGGFAKIFISSEKKCQVSSFGHLKLIIHAIKGLKAARAVRRVADRLENTGLRDSDGKPRDVHIGRPFMPFEGCCICWKDEDKPRILLCDNCDDEYHLYCLDPPLEEIPEGSALIC